MRSTARFISAALFSRHDAKRLRYLRRLQASENDDDEKRKLMASRLPADGCRRAMALAYERRSPSRSRSRMAIESEVRRICPPIESTCERRRLTVAVCVSMSALSELSCPMRRFSSSFVRSIFCAVSEITFCARVCSRRTFSTDCGCLVALLRVRRREAPSASAGTQRASITVVRSMVAARRGIISWRVT